MRSLNIKSFQTNYFNIPIDSDCICFSNKNAILFLNQEKDFYKLYYAYINSADFELLLEQLPSLNIYLEIISKNELPKEQKAVINKYFNYYTTYQKLYKKLSVNNAEILPKCRIDIDLIYQKIYSTFNVYFEHLMDKDELIRLARDKKVLTIYENNELKSFLIYKITGKKAYLNHIANFGSKENLINLWKLFYQVLNSEEIEYLDLWYDINNKKAENMYKIENFQPLNMFNYTFVYSKALPSFHKHKSHQTEVSDIYAKA